MSLTTGYNHVCCIGSVTGGPWHNPGGPGKAESCAFSLALPERGKDGKTYNTHARVETYGCTVAHALELRQGDTVLVEGKLAWAKFAGEGKAALGVTTWRCLKLAGDNPTTA